MSEGIFSCEIDYDTRVEEGPEYHLSVDCGNEAFEFELNGHLLKLTVPSSESRNAGELMPPYLLVETKAPITSAEAEQLQDVLIPWKASFRGWYQVMAYASTQTLVIQPDNVLFARTRLPNNNFARHDGSVTKITPKPYAPEQWHIWPTEPTSRELMYKIIDLSIDNENVPVHYELLTKAIKSFNDEYFDLAATYSAMALERSAYELATAIPRTKADFGESLDHLIGKGVIERGQRRRYIDMFVKLKSDKLTLGGILGLLPVLPFNKPVDGMRSLVAELIEKVNDPRIQVMHYGRHVGRDVAHESVTTTMNVIYGSLAP